MDLETLKEEIRTRADIVDIVGRSVRLQKASGSWKGLCPFHQEKTPSFNVNPRRQTYHCFGCGVGGDVFKFVMEMEHLNFMEALEKLADQVGVPFELDGTRGDGSRKKRLLELHEKTAKWFQELLFNAPEGTEAKTYLDGRKLAPSTPEAFRLGFAPDGFDLFLRQARDWGFTDEEIEYSGLVGVREEARGGEKYYDRFRNRLIFPIVDEQARVIGFSGRVLPSNDSKAKYLNSPETLLFKKSRVLYGIDKARLSMTDKHRAILCEGQLDVIRCHESGLTEAVAAQGTAITEEHAKILKRYADEVLLVLDADAAGIKAALRSAEVLMATGLSVKVSSLPEGGDPDDLVRSQGPERLREVVEASDPFVTFQVRTLVQQEGEINETSRLRVARQVMETVNKIPEAIHREELIRQAAGALGMREDALRQDLRPATPQRREGSSSGRYPSGRAPAPPPQAPHRPSGAPPAAETALLELLCSSPELLDRAPGWIRPRHLGHETPRELLTLLYEWAPLTGETLMDRSREHARGNELFSIVSGARLNLNPDLGSPEDTLRELAVSLRREDLSRIRHRLITEQKQAEPEQQQELDAEIWRLRNLDHQLKTCFAMRDWDKAALLIQMIDQQTDAP